MKSLLLWGGLAVLVIYAVKRFGRPHNDLTVEAAAGKQMRELGAKSTSLTQQATPPLAAVGATPFAGIWLDEFNPGNPAAASRGLTLNLKGPGALK